MDKYTKKFSLSKSFYSGVRKQVHITHWLCSDLDSCLLCSTNCSLLHSLLGSLEVIQECLQKQTSIIITGHLENCEGTIPYFWAKIAPNHATLAKLHYYELIWPKLLLSYFALLGQNCTFSHFLAKITLF